MKKETRPLNTCFLSRRSLGEDGYKTKPILPSVHLGGFCGKKTKQTQLPRFQSKNKVCQKNQSTAKIRRSLGKGGQTQIKPKMGGTFKRSLWVHLTKQTQLTGHRPVILSAPVLSNVEGAKDLCCQNKANSEYSNHEKTKRTQM